MFYRSEIFPSMVYSLISRASRFASILDSPFKSSSIKGRICGHPNILIWNKFGGINLGGKCMVIHQFHQTFPPPKFPLTQGNKLLQILYLLG